MTPGSPCSARSPPWPISYDPDRRFVNDFLVRNHLRWAQPAR